jgi:hypothetical protein
MKLRPCSLKVDIPHKTIEKTLDLTLKIRLTTLEEISRVITRTHDALVSPSKFTF